jgi:hypothetical protein
LFRFISFQMIINNKSLIPISFCVVLFVCFVGSVTQISSFDYTTRSWLPLYKSTPLVVTPPQYTIFSPQICEGRIFLLQIVASFHFQFFRLKQWIFFISLLKWSIFCLALFLSDLLRVEVSVCMFPGPPEISGIKLIGSY